MIVDQPNVCAVHLLGLKSQDMKLIVPGIIGGVVVSILILLIVYLILRRRRGSGRPNSSSDMKYSYENEIYSLECTDNVDSRSGDDRLDLKEEEPSGSLSKDGFSHDTKF